MGYVCVSGGNFSFSDHFVNLYCTKNVLKEAADLVTFTEEFHKGKLHFLCRATKRMISCQTSQIYITIISILSAACKMSVFEVFLVCIFSHSNRIRREIFSLAVSFRFSPNARKYKPENSEYGHISRSEDDFTLDTNIVSKGQKDTLC